MRVLRTRQILVVCCAVTALSGGVRANQVCDYRSREDGNWNDYNTWDCWNGTAWEACADIDEECEDTFPETGDKATIARTHTVSVVNGRTEYVRYLVIEDDASDPGVLQLNSDSSSSSLTIEDDLSMYTGGSPGKIVFAEGGSTDNEGELIIDASMPGAGVIETAATTAGGKITVTGTNTFTISGDLNVADGDLTISGSVHLDAGEVTVSGGDLTFKDDEHEDQDEFENDGEFTISGSSTITVEFQRGIADGSNGDWDINNSNATFKLVTTDSDITATGGDIQLRAGKIDADASFWFDGEMSWSGSDTEIDVAANKVFHATSDG